MQIYSFSPFGYEGSLVTVEVDLRKGIPGIDIVGLADGAVKESKERMQAAIRNSSLEFPPERVLISLSPADLKKEGAGFDLPIALAVLYQQKLIHSENSQDSTLDFPILVLGELELSGKIRNIKGIHAAATTAIASGIHHCIVPAANAEEAREIKGMKAYGAENLFEAFEAMNNTKLFTEKKECFNFSEDSIPENAIEINGIYFPAVQEGFDFKDVKGQQMMVRGLQIAAAGGHNLLAIGAPGCGKTMALQKFPSLLPYLTYEEAQSLTRIYSLSGLLSPNEPLVRIPPFRMPHQTASIEGICGGGVNLKPGEISLAHNGVLFLDEASEFKSSVLQMLRVPLETAKITLARAGRSSVFPADFQLLLASNPCPCGNYGSKTKICLCSSRSIELYWKKFSAPLLDRIDIRLKIDNELHEDNNEKSQSETHSTAELREKIAIAIKMQRKRQGKKNAKLLPAEISEFCEIDEQSRKIISNAETRYGFSPRAISSCLKIARTIADMEESENIQSIHIKEAVDFRKNYSNFMNCSDA